MNLTVKVIDWTIPCFGNNHYLPYGTLLVSDGKRTQRCKTKGDKYTDVGPQYIVFNHRQYKLVYNDKYRHFDPKIELEPIRRSHGSRCQRNGYLIKWNDNYGKWQVCKQGKVLEEFRKFDNAEDFCYEN